MAPAADTHTARRPARDVARCSPARCWGDDHGASATEIDSLGSNGTDGALRMGPDGRNLGGGRVMDLPFEELRTPGPHQGICNGSREPRSTS
jgi:hypothetical protein